MERPTCKTCPYWEKQKETDRRWVLEENSNQFFMPVAPAGGFCRKTPDTLAKGKDSWCGQHPQFPIWLQDSTECIGPKECKYSKDMFNCDHQRWVSYPFGSEPRQVCYHPDGPESGRKRKEGDSKCQD